MRLYHYVGQRDLLELKDSPIARCEPADPASLQAWLHHERISLPATLTFVVTSAGRLRVASRHAEHVVCARGAPVLAAGEIEIALRRDILIVLGVTNQSTGYCPEPECFSAVRAALIECGLAAPAELSHAFTFRRCPSCASRAIVKDAVFECDSCGAELPREWNFDTAPSGSPSGVG